jgi:hypothetical protein
MAAWAAQDCLFRGIRDRVVEGQRGAEVVSWAGMYEWQVQIERELNRRKEARHPSCWEAARRFEQHRHCQSHSGVLRLDRKEEMSEEAWIASVSQTLRLIGKSKRRD